MKVSSLINEVYKTVVLEALRSRERKLEFLISKEFLDSSFFFLSIEVRSPTSRTISVSSFSTEGSTIDLTPHTFRRRAIIFEIMFLRYHTL